MSDTARSAAERFDLPGPIGAIERHAGGHINDSWVVSVAGKGRWFLQRINPTVFPRPELVMENVARVTRHIGGPLQLIGTRDGTDWLSGRSGTWRLFPYLDRAVPRATAETAEEAHAAGVAYGEFQRRLADLPGGRLHETIPGFHDTAARLAALESAVAGDVCGRVAECGREIERALAGRALAGALGGIAPERIVHNDAKIANLLLDRTGELLAVADLDTVMPGLSLHDFGDLARSVAGTVGEDATGEVAIRLEVFEAAARGYLRGAGDLLSREERRELPLAARVITWEQALRFLTDHLAGDVYYRVPRPGLNLIRARNQLALLDGLTRAEPALRARLGG